MSICCPSDANAPGRVRSRIGQRIGSRRAPRANVAAGALLALLLPWAAEAAVYVTTPPRCNGEPMPPLEAPYRMVCALDHGIQVDAKVDQTGVIQAALAALVRTETGLFFPAGTYVVTGELQLRTGNVLVGSGKGVTIFKNTAMPPALIADTPRSADKLLVQDLALQNFSLSFSHGASTVVRRNLMMGTTSAGPQIRSNGAMQLTGNVLLRDRQHAGAGVLLSQSSGVLVQDNHIGLLPKGSRFGQVPGVAHGSGHYTMAVQAAHIESTRFAGNEIALASLAEASAALDAVRIEHAQDLDMDGNTFFIQGGGSAARNGDGPSVTLIAPQGAAVRNNTFAALPLRLQRDSGPAPTPTKDLRVLANLFVASTADTTERTSSWDARSTTPLDILFASNRFDLDDEVACMLSAPRPEVAGMTFLEGGNTTRDGSPARACNLRHV